MSSNAPDLGRRVDGLCREFESRWPSAEDRVAIEAMLERVDESEREPLAFELIALERELLAREGITGDAERYKSRFPEFHDVIDRAFEDPVEVRNPLETLLHEAPTIPPTPRRIVVESPTEALSIAPQRVEGVEATIDLSRPPLSSPGDETQATIDRALSPPEPSTNQARSTVRYFGDYELIQEIARGGMGVVFLARQVNLNRTVALKMILSGQIASEGEVRRFYLEAEAAANLDHPGIVPIYEVGCQDEQHYFSMGYVDGESLAQRVALGPLPPRESASLIAEVSKAVQYAHDQGVIHRDIKPANVLLDRAGHPKVTDFGLAKRLKAGGDSGLTHTGQVMGTPSYMPPEQAAGDLEMVGPQSDVYSLGALLYCLLTGRPPFQASSPLDTLLQVLEREPVPPKQLNPAIGRDLDTICMRCLEKDPARRYESATALGDDLRRYLDGDAIVARRITPYERLLKWAKRRPAVAALLACLTVSLTVGILGIIWQWRVARYEHGIALDMTDKLADRAALLERQLYINRVNLAQREWSANNIAQANQMLDLCPKALRNWEWTYVKKLCNLERVSIKAHDPTPEAILYSLRGVYGIAIRSDGLQIVSGGSDALIKVWDAQTGVSQRVLKGHKKTVFTVAFNKDDTVLASGSLDGEIKLWRTSDWTEIRSIKAHRSWARALTFSPDGTKLVSVSGAYMSYPERDPEIKLWDVANGNLIRSFQGPHDRIQDVAYRPDGKQFATVSIEGLVKFWNPDSEAPERVLQGHSYHVYGVSYSHDGRIVASSALDRTVILWDSSTGAQLRRFQAQDGWAQGVAFSADDKVIFSVGDDNTLRVSELSGEPVNTIRAHTGPVSIVRVSRDGKTVVTGAEDGMIKVWDTSVITSREPTTVTEHYGWAACVAFRPDNLGLASVGYAAVQVWDVPSKVVARQLLTGISGGVQGMVYRADSRTLAIGGGNPGSIEIWDAQAGRKLREWKVGAPEVIGLACSPDGRTLASACSDKRIRVWDSDSKALLYQLEGHSDAVVSVAYSPDGRWLASSARDNSVRLWDLRTHQTVKVFVDVPQYTDDRYGNGLDFSPNSEQLAAAGDDGLVYLWDVKMLTLRATLAGHAGSVNAVAFLNDQRLVSGSEDATVKVWDTKSYENVLTLRGHSRGVRSVDCSPDGRRIASASMDGTAKLWDAAPNPSSAGK